MGSTIEAEHASSEAEQTTPRNTAEVARVPQVARSWEGTTTLSTDRPSKVEVSGVAARGTVAVSASPTPGTARVKQIIAVGGGKGGIGKSLVSSNVAVQLAQSGKKVVLIDADLGGANLHTCLGIPMPKTTLSDFVNRRVAELHDVVTPTGIKSLGLISGALDVLTAADPKYTEKMRLLREIPKLDVDYIVIDLGGGTGFNILDFFNIADHGILTVVPEPTSIENAYRFIKAACYRRLKALEVELGIKPVIDDAAGDKDHRGLKTPAALLEQVAKKDPAAGARLREEFARFPLYLVVNQVRTPEEFQLGRSISEACRKYFGIEMRYLGAIPYDDAVWQAVRHRKPVVLESPNAKASEQIRHIVAALGFQV